MRWSKIESKVRPVRLEESESSQEYMTRAMTPKLGLQERQVYWPYSSISLLPVEGDEVGSIAKQVGATHEKTPGHGATAGARTAKNTRRTTPSIHFETHSRFDVPKILRKENRPRHIFLESHDLCHAINDAC